MFADSLRHAYSHHMPLYLPAAPGADRFADGASYGVGDIFGATRGMVNLPSAYYLQAMQLALQRLIVGHSQPTSIGQFLERLVGGQVAVYRDQLRPKALALQDLARVNRLEAVVADLSGQPTGSRRS